MTKEEKLWALDEAALLAGYEAEEATSLPYIDEMHKVKRILIQIRKEIEEDGPEA